MKTCNLAGLVVVSFLIMFLPQNVLAQSSPTVFTFTKIVDTDTPVPGGTGTFHNVRSARMDQQENVVFLGVDDAGQDGVYLAKDGTIGVIANTSTPIPGGAGTFSFFSQPGVSEGRVVFSSDLSHIYSDLTGSLEVVIDENVFIPGTSIPLRANVRAEIDNGVVVFAGGAIGSNQFQGLYTWNGKNVKVIINQDTPPPVGAIGSSIVGFTSVSADNGAVALLGSTTPTGSTFPREIYLRDASGFSLLVNRNTQVPGTNENFSNTNIQAPRLHDSDIVFQSTGSSIDTRGIYTIVDGKLEVVANHTTLTPGGLGTLSFNTDSSQYYIHRGKVVFAAGDYTGSIGPPPSGIYTNLGGVLEKVIAAGDTLDGKIVRAVGISGNTGGFNGRSFVFQAGFGGSSGGIFIARAQGVPLPALEVVTNVTGSCYREIIPDSVEFQSTSNTEILIFSEKQDILVDQVDVDLSLPGIYESQCLEIDVTTGFCLRTDEGPDLTPATLRGEGVRSFLLHFDPIDLTRLSCTISFPKDILGVIINDDTLKSSDRLLGYIGTIYPDTTIGRGLEVSSQLMGNFDRVRFFGRTLEISLRAENIGDQLRVITSGTPFLPNPPNDPPDDDGDGVPNGEDNCPDVVNPGQEDTDNDGIGDACEDIDGDGIFDMDDNCPDISNPNQEDFNGDGQGDACQDTDDDGLLDSWEIVGIDINNDGTVDLDLPAMGARPNRKDFFVEVDYMATNSHNHRPIIDCPINASCIVFPQSLDIVSAVFQVQNINLDITIDEAVPEIEPIRFISDGPGIADDFNDLKWGNPIEPCGTGPTDGHFGTIADRSSPNCENIIAAKRLVFRYGIFGHNHSRKIGASGIAELGGNDFMVTLGGWSDADFQAVGGRFQAVAGTFMHELGHTLNLLHGGVDNANCKPNYLSVMSYSRQFPNLVPSRLLDYSRNQLIDLDESNLEELDGLGGLCPPLFFVDHNPFLTAYGVNGLPRIASACAPHIDWDGDGFPPPNVVIQDGSSLVAANINRIDIMNCDGSGSQLLGFNDWDNLVGNFRVNDCEFLPSGCPSGAGRVVADQVPETTGEQARQAAELVDSDNDGVTNATDTCPLLVSGNLTDSDGDAVGDVCDNCRGDFNPAQTDSDENGVGDVCQPTDGDGDGVKNSDDECSNSVLSAFVVVDECNTGVDNTLSDNGCTISDKVKECSAAATHGEFVSCVAHLTNDLKKDRIISEEGKEAIQECAAEASIP